MAENAAADRLEAELALLEAMYPEALSFSPKAREVKYVHANPSGLLVLRLPDLYPEAGGLPETITATGPQREDLRSAAKEAIAGLCLTTGEEVLDAIILNFQELLGALASTYPGTEGQVDGTGAGAGEENRSRTVVIWLHHLLNTNKRKLALNPSISGPQPISGLTKPGYPGILVFSGPKTSVDAHVAELRAQRWQAFQVRYDSEDRTSGGDAPKESDCWSFEHGTGIREVESMSELVQGLSDPRQREVFLDAVGVR